VSNSSVELIINGIAMDQVPAAVAACVRVNEYNHFLGILRQGVSNIGG
jgi:hypothetical protein